jgi:hypothetical protein
MPDAPRSPSGGWKTGTPYGGEIAGPSRGARRTVAFIAFLAVAGAVAGVLTYIRGADPPQLVTIPISEYADPAWPPNPFAEEDCDALQAAFPDAAGQEKAYTSQELHLLRTKLEGLKKVKSSQPVVVHLTALGMTRGPTVYVVPGDAKPDDPDTWLPVDAVLDAVAGCPAKHKLLLLDLAHPISHPLHGPLAESIADRLDEHLRARSGRGELPFYVLTSCSKGELSLPLNEEQLSAFAFYLADGLRGAADGFGSDGRVDEQVRVHELTDFLVARVGRWARDCRGLRQTPRLYGDGVNMELSTHRLPRAEPAAARPYPEWLLGAWKKRDEWLTKGAYRSAPAAFNALATALPRAERDWQAAGRPERVSRVDANLKTAIGKAEAGRDSAKFDPPPPLRSVNVWKLPATAPDWAGLIDEFLSARAVAATDPKELEKAKAARAAFVQKAKANDDTRRTAAALIWRKLLDDSAPKRETITELASLLDEVQPSPTNESQVARRLGTWEIPTGRPWPTAAARQLLHTEDAAARALAAAPIAFPWAKAAFTAAGQRRDEGEQLLFEARSREDQARAADVLKQAESAFIAAAAQLAAVQSARAAAEDAAVVLQAAVGPVIDDGGAGWRSWRDAARAASELFARLEQPPPERDLPLGEWESGTSRVTAAVQDLRAPYQPATIKRRVDDLGDPKAGRPGRAPDYQMLAGLLRVPLLATPERKRVWDAFHAIGERMHEQNREADAADDEARRPPSSARPAPLPLEEEADRRGRRAQASVELLRVAGLEKVDDLEAIRRKALADSGPQWEALAAALRKAWTTSLPTQAQARGDAKQWAAAERRERFLPLGAAPTGRPPAAAEVRKRDQADYLKWLEEYYRGLGQSRGADRKAAAFYEDAAKECADGRRTLGD